MKVSWSAVSLVWSAVRDVIHHALEQLGPVPNLPSRTERALSRLGMDISGESPHLVNGVTGLAAGHDVMHHASEQLQRGHRPRVHRQHILQRLLQQIPIKFREQFPVRLCYIISSSRSQLCLNALSLLLAATSTALPSLLTVHSANLPLKTCRHDNKKLSIT